MSHVFTKLCIDFDPILNVSSLDGMLEVVKKQSFSKQVKEAMSAKHSSEDAAKFYRGYFFEWFAEEFLNYYGNRWNLVNVKLNNQLNETAESDIGIDGTAQTANDKSKESEGKYKLTAKRGSPVFIQVKQVNKTHEFSANDGYHIPNFIAAVFAKTRGQLTCYQSRLILFTTGKKLHYSMAAFESMVEVIGHSAISSTMKGDLNFLNHLRGKVGLERISLPYPEADDEEYEE